MSNREVKPASADGTANQWESMSPPFFIESPISLEVGDFFVYILFFLKEFIK
ncbi:hypothetical protein HMPREF9713_02061 [Myroides odoratimimus CCUG 12700]|nr:hypothetical protein HMPREF9713_02061 [Myroides odoratimimus CCUG 12700]